MKIPFHRCELILVIITLLILTSGCTEKQISEPEILAQYPDELGDLSYLITLDEGVNLLNDFVSDDLAIPNVSLPIYYAHGKDVNQDGKAKEWIFGTVIKNDRFFVIVESDRQVLVPYTMSVLDRAIDLKRITLPDALIAGNTQLIKDAFGKNESIPLIRIELMDDTYTVTSTTGSGNKLLYFNAFTGKQINP